MIEKINNKEKKFIPDNKKIFKFLKECNDINRFILFNIISLFFSLHIFAQEPLPVYPIPTTQQIEWQDMEMYAFLHYSLNTYTDQEWGFGNEDVSLFNPEDLDVKQWVEVCKNSGMKGIILTAKHHCGFCLWPSQFTDYSIASSPWKNGEGDIVRELAEACKDAGLKFAVYLSPWDRNHKDYGKPEYIDYFRNQLEELMTNYGDMFEVWFDGANGGNGWYGGANEIRKIDKKTYYDWPTTFNMIRNLQPNALIWNSGGDRGDLRWVGTEAGYVGETNWSLLNKEGDVPKEMLQHGLENGDSWVPGETNTSIRPGWFYHESQDDEVKSVAKLMDIYYKSVGRNSVLLLNFPVMPNGKIHPLDSIRGALFFDQINRSFANNLISSASNIIASNVRNNDIKYSPQNIIDSNKNTYWSTDNGINNAEIVIEFNEPTTFNRFLAEEFIALGQRVKKFSLEAMINGEWTKLNDNLSDSGEGMTTIGHRRIICFDPVTTTKLKFKIEDSKDSPLISQIGIYNAPEIIEESIKLNTKSSSNLHISKENDNSIIIALDNLTKIEGLKYLPPENREGTITHYILWTSTDGIEWNKVSSGEFSNIINNPIWQTIKFPLTETKFIKLEAENIVGATAQYEDIDIIIP